MCWRTSRALTDHRGQTPCQVAASLRVARLGDLLERQGDSAGAKTAWQPVIDSRDSEWAGVAFTSLVNLLRDEDDPDGLRAAYQAGAALGNPERPGPFQFAGFGEHGTVVARLDIGPPSA